MCVCVCVCVCVEEFFLKLQHAMFLASVYSNVYAPYCDTYITHSTAFLFLRYLLKREVVLTLLEQMVAEDGDTMARQNILGALQKLSLRRKAQSYMIELGAISWLHEALTHRSELCEYSEEYVVPDSFLFVNTRLCMVDSV